MDGVKRPALKLQAAGALLALLVGWVSTPIALAGAQLDICSMPCCVSEGHCCCSPRHARVAGESQGDHDGISKAEVSESCPVGCAAATWSARLQLRDLVRTTSYGLGLAGPVAIESHRPPIVRDLIDSGSSSPRAPPFLTSFSTI